MILLFSTIAATILSSFSALRSVTPPPPPPPRATCVAMICLISQPIRILIILSPVLLGRCFLELPAVPLHSVRPLFGQLQCYAFKRCETSAREKLPNVTAPLLASFLVHTTAFPSPVLLHFVLTTVSCPGWSSDVCRDS